MTVQELIDKLNELTDEQKQLPATIYDRSYCCYLPIKTIEMETKRNGETVVCLDEEK